MFILAAQTRKEIIKAGFKPVKVYCAYSYETIYCARINQGHYMALLLKYEEYQDREGFDERGIYIFGTYWQYLCEEYYREAVIALS